jgi:hypothetical protein
LIWNSTLPVFHLKVNGIDDAIGTEKERFMEAKEMELEERKKRQEQEQQSAATEETDVSHLSKEERDQRRERRRREYEERVRQEQKEMGMKKWKELDEEKRKVTYLRNRLRTLAKLSEVGTLVIGSNVGMDVDIAHLGWFGILSPRATMIKAFAPNTGVRVTCHPSLALPKKWGSFDKPRDENVQAKGSKSNKGTKAKGTRRSGGGGGDDVDLNFEDGFDEETGYLGDDFDDDFDDDMDFDEEEGDDDESLFGGGMYDSPYTEDMDGGADGGSSFRYVRGSRNPFQGHGGEDKKDTPKDPWAKFSGENVGWHYITDVRFSKNPNIKDGWNPIPKLEKTPEEVESDDEY